MTPHTFTCMPTHALHIIHTYNLARPVIHLSSRYPVSNQRFHSLMRHRYDGCCMNFFSYCLPWEDFGMAAWSSVLPFFSVCWSMALLVCICSAWLEPVEPMFACVNSKNYGAEGEPVLTCYLLFLCPPDVINVWCKSTHHRASCGTQGLPWHLMQRCQALI